MSAAGPWGFPPGACCYEYAMADHRGFAPPTATCNARLARSDGYCRNKAGAGTDHVGWGRCSIHGGGLEGVGADGATDLWAASGFQRMLDIAAVTTPADEERLTAGSNAALVTIRAGIISRMLDQRLTPAELNALSQVLARVDRMVAAVPQEEDPDAAPNTLTDQERAAMDAVAELERLYAVES